MKIEHYKIDGGRYQDKDGCIYESAQEFLQSGILGFCGCGDPDISLKYIKDSLTLIEAYSNIATPDFEDYGEPFKGKGDVYFIWYFLDQEGFTSHGSSVPGHLTKKGEDFLSDLRDYFKNKDEV